MVQVTQQHSTGFLARLGRICRHRWFDEATVHRVLPADLLDRLTQRVAASERRHSGEIRICVEAGLPLSYLWRSAPARQRAVMLFGKLRTWDTEHNNGVLIYLLLAEHSIEIIADRGLARQVDAAEWQRVTGAMSAAFKSGQFEAGLNQAVDAVDGLLAKHFALAPGEVNRNELPDAPFLR